MTRAKNAGFFWVIDFRLGGIKIYISYININKV